VHASLRNIFQKLHMASPTVSYTTKLKAADFAFNTCPPRQGSLPSLLVFGQVSRPPCADFESHLALKNDERLGLMAIAREEAEVQHIRHRYIEIERRAAPTDCDSLSTGVLCLAYRDVGEFVYRKPGFTGPFIFLYRQGSVAFFLDGSIVRRLASSHVKAATASEKYRADDRASSVFAGRQLEETIDQDCNRHSSQEIDDSEVGKDLEHEDTSEVAPGGTNPAYSDVPGPATLLDRSAASLMSSNAWISSHLAMSRDVISQLPPSRVLLSLLRLMLKLMFRDTRRIAPCLVLFRSP
jgi:hypothetical protein